MIGATRKAAATHARPTLRRFGRLTCASVGIKRMQNATRAMAIKGDALKASLVYWRLGRCAVGCCFVGAFYPKIIRAKSKSSFAP